MSLETLANLGEFVSGVAVVVSLVYLAFQVRQNTRSLRTDTFGRALDRVAAVQARLGTDAALIGIFNRGALDTSRLTPEERIQFTWAFYEMFGAFEFMYHQAQEGALSDEMWDRWAATLSWWLSMPGVRMWWRAKPAPFSSSFSAFVDGRLDSGASNVSADQLWQEFLRKGSVSSADSSPSA